TIFPGYFSDPYRCIVLIETTAGARIITFDPVQMPTAAELDELVKKSEELALVICNKFIVDINQGIHVEWLIDPDPTDLVSRLVTVSLAGLPAGSPVQLEAPGGQVIDQSVTDRSGRVRVSGLTAAASLTLKGGAGLQAGGLGAPSAVGAVMAATIPTQVSIRQSGLRQLGGIELPGGLLGFQLGAFRGARTLLCALPGEINLYDASNPRLPRLSRRRALDSVIGAFLLGETIYAWGDCGLIVWDPEGAREPAGCHLPDERPIRAAAASSGFFYLLAGDKLVVYDRRFTRLAATPA